MILDGNLYAQVERLRAHGTQDVDHRKHMGLERLRTPAVRGAAQKAAHHLGAHRLGNAELLQRELRRIAGFLIIGARRGTDRTDGGFNQDAKTLRIIPQLGELRGFEAFESVRTRKHDGVELQRLGIVEYLGGLPPERPDRVRIHAQPMFG